MSSTDFITRKEFEERMASFTSRYEDRHAGIQAQLSEALGIVKTNQQQINALTSGQNEMQKAQSALDKSVAIATTMNKYLWPTVTALASIVMFLIGGGHL
jgi:cell division protein FtsX